VRLKDLSPADRARFSESDAKEWAAMLATGAVRVLSPEESVSARRRFPDRILSSRMVRRLKPVQGVGSLPEPKSRWCVHGHQDPDSETLEVYAPTPQSESVLMCLQIAASFGWTLTIADAKNAFCQSQRLERPRGAIFVEPCSGLPIGPDQLIELVAPVYGLNDAPLLWHRTLTDWLVGEGFTKSLLEPCLRLKRSRWGKLEGSVLIEVDDLIVSGGPAFLANFKEKATARFRFGKWCQSDSEFAGRHLRQFQVKSYRAVVAQVQWVARESRPDVAGAASILAGAMPTPLVSHALLLGKVCKFLKATASQRLTIWALDPVSLVFVTASDASGPGSASRGGSQGAWLVMAADASIRANRRARVSLLSWRSQRLKRVISSTVAAETLALSSAVAEAQYLQVLWRDAVFGDVQKPAWHLSAAPFSVVMSSSCELGSRAASLAVVDAKSVFDTLSKNAAGSRSDRRNAVELAVVRDSLSSMGSQIRWLPHGRMPADPLTHADPAKSNLALHDLLCRGTLCLVDEGGHLDERSLNLSLKSRREGPGAPAFLAFELQVRQALADPRAHRAGGQPRTAALGKETLG
ncbi:unnamed protein product, partial [Prorocentrum cordatum]